jgi:hypothetical protein
MPMYVSCLGEWKGLLRLHEGENGRRLHCSCLGECAKHFLDPLFCWLTLQSLSYNLYLSFLVGTVIPFSMMYSSKFKVYMWVFYWLIFMQSHRTFIIRSYISLYIITNSILLSHLPMFLYFCVATIVSEVMLFIYEGIDWYCDIG